MSSNQQSSQKSEPDSSTESSKPKKNMNVKVIFLDDSSHTFQIPSKALGRTLFDKTCKYLNLLEADYFGLQYEDEAKTKYWLDGLKPLCRQVGLVTSSPTLYFCVKFYTPDPVQLEDEYTRYFFSLQIKKDLASGVLQCNDNTAAVMISYVVQAEIGDFDPVQYPDHTYLSQNKFIPYQDAELERKIMESHKKHIGQLPAEAEGNLLETARRCELYGIKMTAAKDNEGVPLNLAVAHLGVLVFQNYTKINTFSWAKIRKLSFKRKRFLIKLHPEGYGYYKDTVEFCFEGRNECKNFWKKCIENHTFFRCSDAKKGMRQKPKFFSRGSSFRYSGRTQVQVSEYVRENYVKRPFQRSTSLRTGSNSSSPPPHPRTASGSISPQPLLPVSTSFSCESVSTSPVAPSPPPVKKLSTSEPTTPHVAQDILHSIANGRVPTMDEKSQTTSPGLMTPDSEHGDMQSPDFLGQDTDDNISQDSYHVIDKDVKSPTADSCTEVIDQADTETTLTGPMSTVLETEGKSTSKIEDTETLKEMNHFPSYNGVAAKPLKWAIDDTQLSQNAQKEGKSRPRVRVTMSNPCLGQISPTLYARASHFSRQNNGQETGLLQSRVRTLDFVLVNQLPSIGSFSYKDDSLDVKSPSRAKLELLKQKLVENNISINNQVVVPPNNPVIMAIPKNGIITSSDSHAIKVPPDNHTVETPLGDHAIEAPPDKLMITAPPDNLMITAPPDNLMITAPPDNLMITAPPDNLMITAPPHKLMITAPPHNFMITAPPDNVMIAAPPDIIQSCTSQSVQPYDNSNFDANISHVPSNLPVAHMDSGFYWSRDGSVPVLPESSQPIEPTVFDSCNHVYNVPAAESGSIGNPLENASSYAAISPNIQSVTTEECELFYPSFYMEDYRYDSHVDSSNKYSYPLYKFSHIDNRVNGSVEEGDVSKEKESSYVSNLSVCLSKPPSSPTSNGSEKLPNQVSDVNNVNLAKTKEEITQPSSKLPVNGFSEKTEDSENACLDDTSNFWDSLGVPAFCSDSFSSLADTHLINYKKFLNDKGYFIAKELLMTERTYRRDLEIIDVIFREEFNKQGDMPNEAVELMLATVDPLYEIHCSLLRELEQRMAFWEGKHLKVIQNGVKAVGDILINFKKMTKVYELYVEKLPQILDQLSTAFLGNQRFANFYQRFENMKLCYLPLTSLLLKPLHRLSYYSYMTKELMLCNGKMHFDFENCQGVHLEFQKSSDGFSSKIPSLVNTVKMLELRRNLSGFPDTPNPERVFLREGCLQKLSKNGNHQCMLFLFSDMLLYTKQTQTGKLLFNVCRTLFLPDIEVEEAEPRQCADYCILIREKERCLLLATSSEKEQCKWLTDLKEAIINQSESSTAVQTSQSTVEAMSNKALSTESEEKRATRHVNTSVHVCWHRNISIGKQDVLVSSKYSISGFLLRKFTNNTGWQKLWVVLSNLCLFFYKSYLDDSPLASLPLAGYRVLTPSNDDSITKDFVFKLQYKHHVYYFRSESQHSFDRWMEIVGYSTLAEDEKTRL